ncbi:MAG TPA: NDP-sugar synthase [Blastocatellia bacterium]|nr:NDP-sugar synthase [Blastocatellia bacterium]
MKGFILAAGFGTRLWPLTEDRTKAAVPFLNRPLIGYSVEYLASYGIRDTIVNLHHQPDSIRRVLRDGSDFGARITYSFEEEILGTSGALDPVRDALVDEDFVVINGKIVTDIDLREAITVHQQQNAIATLVLRENAAREHFSIVEVDERGWITRFAGFPDVAASQAGAAEAIRNVDVASSTNPAPLMFTGIQVLSPRIFDYIPCGSFSHSTLHVYPQAIANREAVIGHVADGNWYEMSTLQRYLDASLRLNREQGESIVAGCDCRVEDHADVKDCVMWDRVVVERGACVMHCVLGDNVRIPAGSLIERAVIVRRDILSEIERGEVSGDNVIVPI